MPRVLILGLYYPPANFMAGRRLEGWARYLPEFGYEPLVLTRFYDPEERDTHDFFASSRATRTLSQPWMEQNRAVYTRFDASSWSSAPLPGKVRGLVHYAWPDPDHSVWLQRCRQYLEQTKYKPDLIVASYSPAGIFRVASKLSQWLAVPWIADFRDLWLDPADRSWDARLKIFFQRRHLRTAAGITVVSDAMVGEIKRQLEPARQPIRLIYSGAESTNSAQPDSRDHAALDVFENLRRSGMVLSYAGTLYPEQEIARFLDTIAKFKSRRGEDCSVVLCGGHEPEDYSKWPFVKVLGPVSHSTAMYILRQSNALFYPAWPGRYTGFSGKFFEQVISGRPVLVAFQPSADLENVSSRFPSVIVAHEEEELISALERLPHEGSGTSPDIPMIATKKYWVGELAKFFDEILLRSNNET